MAKLSSVFGWRGRVFASAVFGALALSVLIPATADAHWDDRGWEGGPYYHHHRWPPPPPPYYYRRPPPPVVYYPPPMGYGYYRPPVVVAPAPAYGPPPVMWGPPPGVSFGVTVPFR